MIKVQQENTIVESVRVVTLLSFQHPNGVTQQVVKPGVHN